MSFVWVGEKERGQEEKNEKTMEDIRDIQDDRERGEEREVRERDMDKKQRKEPPGTH